MTAKFIVKWNDITGFFFVLWSVLLRDKIVSFDLFVIKWVFFESIICRSFIIYNVFLVFLYYLIKFHTAPRKVPSHAKGETFFNFKRLLRFFFSFLDRLKSWSFLKQLFIISSLARSFRFGDWILYMMLVISSSKLYHRQQVIIIYRRNINWRWWEFRIISRSRFGMMFLRSNGLVGWIS